MTLLSLPATELLDRFASPEPTPGGGSAAAFAGALGASLVAMVCAMPKTRTGTPEERERLDAAGAAAANTGRRLRELIDEDTQAYDAVVAGYRLPKSTDAEKALRKEAIATAMRAATEVPVETATACIAVLMAARVAASDGNPNAASDAQTASALAWAAFQGAAANVRINAGSAGDRGREALSTVERLAAQGRDLVGEAS